MVCPSNFVLFINSFIDKIIIDKTCQNIITMIYYILAIIFLLLQNEPRKIKKKINLATVYDSALSFVSVKCCAEHIPQDQFSGFHQTASVEKETFLKLCF